MKKKQLSLKSKIILSIIFSALFLCVLVIIMSFTYLNNILTDNKFKEIEKLNIEQVDEIVNIFKNDQTFAKMLGTRTRVREYLIDPTEFRRAELLEIFSEYAKEDNKYLSLYLLNKDGNAVISTDPNFVGQNYSFRDYYKNGMLGSPSVDLLLGKTSNQFGYYFSYPVFDENKNTIGVFVAKISNKEIDSSIYDSEITTDSTLMLVDDNGVVIASNKKDRFLKTLGFLTEEEKQNILNSSKFLDKEILPLQYDIAQKSIRGREINRILEFKDKEDGQFEILNINKIGEFPFYLVTETGMDGIRTTVYRTIIILIGLIILSVLIACFFIYDLIIKSLSPLNKLKKLSENIASGNFSQKIDIDSNDEFGDLASAFNKMSTDLNNLYKNLDKKVEERTKDIELKSQEIDSQKSAILNILEDVESEKNKVENLANDLEKFKLAVENASDQIVITDPEGIVIYGNNAIEKITGYKKEEALGSKAGVLWKNPMPLSYYEKMWDIIKNKKEVFIGEIQNKRKSGDIYIASISISPVLNEDNDILYYVAIEHDITKEKEIDKAKTEFVSLASHQLRTPLSSINWYTEMLLAEDAGKINDEQRKYLNEVAIGNKRMVELVNSLLNVSRLDLGTFMIEPEQVNVNEMIESVSLELKPQIKEKNLKIEEEYKNDISKFNADKKLLRMIIQNLLSNAVKYTPKDGIIKISASFYNRGEIFGEKELENDSFALCVSDSGIGIPENQKEKIFSKLFRADNARESETEGTGLGLYVIKAIVDQSGGFVWFKSEEGKGSTFYIIFSKDGMNKKEGTKKLD